MTAYKYPNHIKRDVGLTTCPFGYNDLVPETGQPDARWWERCEDFIADSLHTRSPIGTVEKAWCPAYLRRQHNNQEIVADLMVFDFHGFSASHIHQWIVQHNLAGLVHPTKSDTFIAPRSRAILLLSRAVEQDTYRLLWSRIANDAFGHVPNPAHADCCQRFDVPRAVNGRSEVLRHDGNPLAVDHALALPVCDGNALGIASRTHADEEKAARINHRPLA